MMRIICSQSELLKSLNIALKAVPVRTTMPILQYVMIDATTSDIRLTTNDMQIGIETLVKGKIIERGKVALDAKTLMDFVNNLPDGDVNISVDEQMTARINSGKALFTITGKSGEDFPYLQMIPRNNPISVSQLVLKDTIRQTIFSVSENESNLIMTGELFEIDNNRMRVTSLDGHRISIRYINLKNGQSKVSAIVPKKAISELSKILNGSMEDMVNIYVTENHIVFDFEQTTMVSRLIEGKFFDIDRMLSNDYDTKVTINRKNAIESMKRASLMVNEMDKKPIIFDIREQLFNMSIKSYRGNYEDELPIIQEGKDLKIAFNPKFMIEALRSIDDENVNMYFLNHISPCFIRDDDGNYIYLILPVNYNLG